MRYLIILLTIFSITGCASQIYKNTEKGKFEGSLDIRWTKNNLFLFIPNKEHPLVFIRANGEIIRPGIMYTDGGSIPRFLWGVKGLSPWGYAPAYIVHDWLFEAQHCNHAPDNKYSFNDSANVMAESLKAIMERNKEVRNYFVYDSIVSAVQSPIAKQLWDDGSCNSKKLSVFLPKLMGEIFEAIPEPPGKLIMSIKFE